VKAITTRDQLKAYFDDVVVLATETEQSEFQQLNLHDAEKFFRNFWFSRDYDMNLTPGVRLIQHYSRVQEADSLFRVPFRTRSPGISTLMAYVPPENVPYDDRGIVFIKQGRPSQTFTDRGEGLHPNETWVYYRNEGDLILNFVALKGSQEYQLVTSLTAAVMNYRGFYATVSSGPEENYRLHWMTELYSSRLEVGNGIYFRLMNDPYDPFVHLEEYEQNLLSIQTGLGTESVPFPYDERLESYYDLVEFRGDSDGKSTIEFYSGVPGKEITFTNGSGHYNYEIRSQLAIYDQNWNQVNWLEQDDKHSSLISPKDLENREVVGVGKVDLPPGEYYYFVKIQNGPSVGNFDGQIRVGSYGRDSLQTSQILTARNIYPSPADSSKFMRYGLEIEPHPSRTFQPSEKMYAYQEIYNLTPDQEGNYNYRVTYSMALIERDRNVFGKIYDSFKMLMGTDPGQEHVVLTFDKKKAPVDKGMVQEDVGIDLSENSNGLYELSILVEDLNNEGRSFHRNTRFFVRR
jgi:GWxTD domain-containing protein